MNKRGYTLFYSFLEVGKGYRYWKRAIAKWELKTSKEKIGGTQCYMNSMLYVIKRSGWTLVSPNSEDGRGWTIRKFDIIKDGHSWLKNNNLVWDDNRKLLCYAD